MRGHCSDGPWLPREHATRPRFPTHDAETGSGPLPEDFAVGVRFLPEHTSLSCPDAPCPPHPNPLPQGEREEAQTDKPVRGRSSQEKKGLPPPPGPPFFPPPEGAEKTEDAQDGHRGLSFPPFPPVLPALTPPSCPDLAPPSCPDLAPLSCPDLAPLSCRRAPLSFPQVVSGNPVSFSSVPSFVWACMGKSRGFPIKNVGNDSEGIENVGNDGGGLKTSGMPWGIVWPRMERGRLRSSGGELQRWGSLPAGAHFIVMPRPLTPTLSRKGRGRAAEAQASKPVRGPLLPGEDAAPPTTWSPILPAAKRCRKDRESAGRSEGGAGRSEGCGKVRGVREGQRGSGRSEGVGKVRGGRGQSCSLSLRERGRGEGLSEM